jgi:ankyrin repeat protein
MFTRTHTFSRNNNDDIIVAIVTNNLTTLKLILNKNNVNNIIDTKNNYTALHYAVTLPNNDITKFILELGGDPKIKQNDGYDVYELSLRSGKKYIFQYTEQIQQIKIDDLKLENVKLNSTINNLKRTNQYLNESIDNFNDKVNSLNNIIETKDNEMRKIIIDLEESDRAFCNLLKKQKTNIHNN